MFSPLGASEVFPPFPLKMLPGGYLGGHHRISHHPIPPINHLITLKKESYSPPFLFFTPFQKGPEDFLPLPFPLQKTPFSFDHGSHQYMLSKARHSVRQCFRLPLWELDFLFAWRPGLAPWKQPFRCAVFPGWRPFVPLSGFQPHRWRGPFI